MTIKIFVRLPVILSLLISMSPQHIYAKFIILENKEQHEDLLQKNEPMLLQFAIEDCPACKQVKKPVEEVAQEQEFENIVIARINTKKLKSLAELYHIKSIPTFVYLNNGKKVETIVGVKNANSIKEDLRANIRKNLMPDTKINNISEPEKKKPSAIKTEKETDYTRELSEQGAQLSIKNVIQKQKQTNENKVQKKEKSTDSNTQNNFFDTIKNLFSSLLTTVTLYIQKIVQTIKNIFN